VTSTSPGNHSTAGRRSHRRIPLVLWPVILLVFVVGTVSAAALQFTGDFDGTIPVTLMSHRSGLVMESGARVELRGVQVGRVGGIDGGHQPVRLRLQLFPDQIKHIPANVSAEIKATTVFGAKFVELVVPEHASAHHISAGAVLFSRNVSTEVDTVFEHLVDVLNKIDPAKLNAVLTALAEAVRGQGDRIGEATTAANQVLLAVNPRMPALQEDLRSVRGFADVYGGAAQDLVSILDAATTTSKTITGHAQDLNALLLNIIGFGDSAVSLLAPNQANLVKAINELRPTADLLMKYNPEYTCVLTGAKWFYDHGGYDAIGGNGRSVVVDSTLLLGSDPYRYPDNLPIVAAKGGPGGTPGCGSLPDASKDYPVRALVTNTGWGTGLDIRPNPGIGFPGWVNFLPFTKAIPEPPRIRYPGGPAPGPITYPGGPPYGAPLYGADGTPLYPGVPPLPAPTASAPGSGSPPTNQEAIAPPDTPSP
jgi:phospholipid/cholesterol/gamma-HCH transport system substrate-binding protein